MRCPSCRTSIKHLAVNTEKSRTPGTCTHAVASGTTAATTGDEAGQEHYGARWSWSSRGSSGRRCCCRSKSWLGRGERRCGARARGTGRVRLGHGEARERACAAARKQRRRTCYDAGSSSAREAAATAASHGTGAEAGARERGRRWCGRRCGLEGAPWQRRLAPGGGDACKQLPARSEERRVGKEC